MRMRDLRRILAKARKTKGTLFDTPTVSLHLKKLRLDHDDGCILVYRSKKAAPLSIRERSQNGQIEYIVEVETQHLERLVTGVK